MSALSDMKEKSKVLHDTECPYWDQLSLNNTLKLKFDCVFRQQMYNDLQQLEIPTVVILDSAVG